MATAATTATGGANALQSLLGQGAAQSTVDETGERFLKMLVAQMQNQDPLNPMDNAEVTSQMAQINTVTGISNLQKAMTEMNGLLAQMQSLQATALVGRDVLLAGDSLVPDAQHLASGGFELDSPAQAVRVAIVDASGRTVGTLDLGALGAGRHTFDWTAPADAPGGLRFQIDARAAGGASVGARALVSDTVDAVYADGATLMVELRARGPVPYAQVRAID